MNSKLKYHTINANPKDLPMASTFKPYFNVVLDDKAIRVNWQEKKKKKALINEIKKVLKWSEEHGKI